jgi:hypothetical protein
MGTVEDRDWVQDNPVTIVHGVNNLAAIVHDNSEVPVLGTANIDDGYDTAGSRMDLEDAIDPLAAAMGWRVEEGPKAADSRPGMRIPLDSEDGRDGMGDYRRRSQSSPSLRERCFSLLRERKDKEELRKN